MKNEKIISVTNLFQHLSSANQCKKQAKSKDSLIIQFFLRKK